MQKTAFPWESENPFSAIFVVLWKVKNSATGIGELCHRHSFGVFA